MAETINIFVYGTLLPPRPGSNPADSFNFEKVAVFIHNIVPARLRGAALYDFGSFPGAYRAEGTIQGFVLQVDPLALEVLDPLEGHPDMYYREQVTVESQDGEMEAWIYWAPNELKPMGTPIPNGDWLGRNS
jgi:gamma-glutamylcyclotransferase (GGCT)/AIG2-like uncharacterized protein YtfP